MRKTITLGLIVTLFVGLSTAATAAPGPRISGTTIKQRKALKRNIANNQARARSRKTVVMYFKYLADGNRKVAKITDRPLQPLKRFRYIDGTDNPGAGANDSITPVKITKEEWYANAPAGPMYALANWWCSAAAVNLYYTPDATTRDFLGIFSGDCTNPNAGITGRFYPQRLGVFDPTIPVRFTLDDVNPNNQVINSATTDDPTACDVGYYRSFGHRDVYAIQFTCDDGKHIGARTDDVQFTAYVFPPNWPEAANVEAVLKRLDSDDDKDGLQQKAEQLIGTNPNRKDTDGDGLIDGDEYIAYETSPLVMDTDGDGVDDATEVKQEANPLGPGTATADQQSRWARLKFRKAPTISGLTVTSSGGSATVSWTTNIAADGIVNWGLTTSYGSYRSDFAFTKSHAITFTVTPGTTYHYAVRACSTAPNPQCTTTEDKSFVAE